MVAVEPPSVPDAFPHFVAEVFEAAGALRRRGDALAGAVGQTQARWQVLWVLVEERRTVPQAARRLGVTRQAVQRIVDQLVDLGLVGLEANPDHVRSRHVVATDAGHAALRAIEGRARPWFDQIAARIAPEELATAQRCLRAIIDLT